MKLKFHKLAAVSKAWALSCFVLFGAWAAPPSSCAAGIPMNAGQRDEIERFLVSTVTMMAYSPELGWTMRPSTKGGYYATNSAGMRSEREYAKRPAAGKLRVAAFGDSFTFGADIQAADTWEEMISSADPRIEILNYGVPAYGLDQALLRYKREGARFHPRIVLIGYMVAGIHRNIMTFRPYWHPGAGMPFSKPRFILKDGKLVLIPNPLPRLKDYETLLGSPDAWPPALAENDWFYHARYGPPPANKHGPEYDANAEGFQVLASIMEEFCADVRRDGAVPLIIIFPERGSLETSRRGRPRPYQLLLDALQTRGLDYFDAAEPLVRAADVPIEQMFTAGGHFSGKANRIFAESLRQRLESRIPK